MEEFLAYLNEICPLSDQLLSLIPSMMALHHYPKNQIIATDILVKNRFLFVIKGVVRYSCYHRGQEMSKWFFIDKDVISLHQAVKTNEQTQEHLIAFRPTSLLSVNFTTLEQSYARYPELEHYGRIIAERYSVLWFSILDGIRLKTAEERLYFLKETFPQLIQTVPIRHLAACIDMNPYTAIKVQSRGARQRK